MKTFEDIRKDGDLLFESIRGSHLFGLNTETSDIDTFGVFCGPEDWFLGSGKDLQSFIKSEKNDDYWDELSKYFLELGKSNPEALVSLFTPERFILHFDPILKPLWDIRDQLLTKECFKSFSGYAYSQIKKAKGLKKAINTDPSEVKERKTPLHFCQVPVGIGTHTLIKWLEDNKLRPECCGLSRLPNSNECYSLFYDYGKAKELGDNIEINKPVIGYRGILSPSDPLSSQLRLSSIPKDETPLCWFQFNSNAYVSHCIEYKRYWDWVNNRNEARFQLNSGYNYDCYSVINTKFLTKRGWLWYKDIEDNDLIASFTKGGELYYSKIKSRTFHRPEPTQTIKINTYIDNTNNICFYVTDNHRLWVRRSDWEDFGFVTAFDVYNDLKVGFKYYQLNTIKNTSEDFEISDILIRFLAIYIANGSYYILTKEDEETIFLASIFYDTYSEVFIKTVLSNCNIDYCEDGVYMLRFEFPEDNRIYNSLKSLYLDDDSSEILEILSLFSTRQFNIFIDALCRLSRKTYFKRYDKFAKFRLDLVHSVRTNKFLDGFNKICKLHGYEHYPLKINGVDYSIILKNPIQEIPIYLKNWTVESFCGDDNRSEVCCFETETGTLITSGYIEEKYSSSVRFGISFHGNSKNISHCVRIFTMAKEIADGKGMLLDRTDIDRDFLLSIKNHKLSYDEVMMYVENLKDDMEESFIKSTIPDSPDLDLLDKILIKIRKDHYSKKA